MPIISLPYQTDSTKLFDAIRDLPFACWLDSGKPHSHSGRYDIMTAIPSMRWVTQQHNQNITQILHYDCTRPINELTETAITQSESSAPPLELLKAAAMALPDDEGLSNPNYTDLPFYGGLIANVSYEFGSDLMDISQQSPRHCHLPNMVTGLYTWAIIQDHEQHTCWLASLTTCPMPLFTALTDYFSRLCDHFENSEYQQQASEPSLVIEALKSNTEEAEYHQKIDRIHRYIQAGDCYQVNLSQCFSGPYQGDPYIAYRELRKTMASPFSAFIDFGKDNASYPRVLMSLSPERFLSVKGQQVLTQPIKGTVTRHEHALQDKANAQDLQSSEKNQAENLMIVDLLRNDLGKNCIAGSIDVPRLFDLESYPNVHHLVSSVTGTLANNTHAIDLFEGCFPGGSITGAPKKRAMEIIEELEDCQRSMYCGSILYINARGDMDSNITIRTLAADGDSLYCWGGGGIVADSEASDEYQESITKIGTILATLNNYH